jgi:hypothetical protein
LIHVIFNTSVYQATSFIPPNQSANEIICAQTVAPTNAAICAPVLLLYVDASSASLNRNAASWPPDWAAPVAPF